MTAGKINFPDKKANKRYGKEWRERNRDKHRADSLAYYRENKTKILREAKKREKAWRKFSKTLRVEFLKLYAEGKL